MSILREKEGNMITNPTNIFSNRRQFLKNVLPAGTFFCLGCNSLFASPQSDSKKQTDTEKHPFKQKTGMTVEETYRFALQHGRIGQLKWLAKEIGKEKFIEMLKQYAVEETELVMTKVVQNMRKRDLGMLKIMMKNYNVPYNYTRVTEIVEDTDKVYEVHHSECIYAKLYREEDAADIGYAMVCHDYETVYSTFNPKIKFSNPKNLMKGDDVCIERLVWEG
jgi:hypothetical protein